MRQFDLNNKVNPQKVFILQSSEIEKRLDPFYYVPSIRKLEEQVKKHKPEPLRKHILSVSSGATPKTTEKEKYYSDKENGIPFLRVQNLSPTGILDIENCKYINKETHENYLKRSQVEGGDLLVKITGVGRMAVASVAPDGFIGNTNQHMVVIKTGSKEKSELLAAYLNTDIAERLASRRATGGTRPALDYPALLSMPIILNEKILEIRKKAIDIKQIKEKEAYDLLNSIDDYLLSELDIKIPKKDNSLKNRIFRVNYSELSGNRLESNYYTEYNRDLIKSIESSKFPVEKINKTCDFVPGYAFSSKDYVEESDCILITIKNISKNIIDFKKRTYLPSSFYDEYSRFKINNGDLLIAMTGATIGKVGIFEGNKKALLNQRNGIIKSNKLDTYFLMNLLNTEIFQNIILRNSVGGAQPNISESDITKIKIPVPDSNLQSKISEHIKSIRSKAFDKQKEAKDALKLAKKEIEHLILGEQ